MERIAVRPLSVVAALAIAGCGGTTGHELLPSTSASGSSNDATMVGDDGSLPTDDGGIADATMGMGDESIYTGTFDVLIPFADQELPDVQGVPEAGSGGASGAEAGTGLPDCPPFIPVNGTSDYTVVSVAQAGYLVPADYGVDGGVTFAADGGVCATYPWLGSPAADRCAGVVLAGTPQTLPPCSWAVEAGTAAQGPKATVSRYDICIALFECYMRTQCFTEVTSGSSVPGQECFCGRNDAGVVANIPQCEKNPQGDCLNEILAGSELPGDPATVAPTILVNFASTGQQAAGWPSYWLNYMMKTAVVGSCFDISDGGP